MLHEPAEEVKKQDIGSARIEKTINDMVDVMRAGPGVGLAAPQIGVPLQVMLTIPCWLPSINTFCCQMLILVAECLIM